MKSTLENVEEAPGKRVVKLSLTVDESEFDRDIDKAFRKIANEIRLPGFRAGKVPRKVLEARIGLGAGARAGAARRDPELPRLAPSASTTSTSSPRRRSTSATARSRARSSSTPRARCAPRSPSPATAACASSCPTLAASDEEIDEAVNAELRRHGSLVDVDRPIQSGDQVTLTLAASPRRRAGAGPQHRGLAVRGRPRLGRSRASTPSCSAPTAGARADVHRHAERHRGARRLRGPRRQGAGDGPARADRRVGRREHRRVRHGRGVPHAASPSGSTTGKLNQARNQFIDRAHDGARRARRHRAAGVDGQRRPRSSGCRTPCSSSRRRASRSSSGCRRPDRTRRVHRGA